MSTAFQCSAVQVSYLSSPSFILCLGDSVSVRYFFRLIIEDGEGECKWNTTEVVLFRAKAPYFNMSDIDSDTTAVV